MYLNLVHQHVIQVHYLTDRDRDTDRFVAHFRKYCAVQASLLKSLILQSKRASCGGRKTG